MKPERVNWYEVRRAIFHKHGLAIDGMTLPEIELALDADFDKPRPSNPGAVILSSQEHMAYFAWRRSLSVVKAFDLARRNQLSPRSWLERQ